MQDELFTGLFTNDLTEFFVHEVQSYFIFLDLNTSSGILSHAILVKPFAASAAFNKKSVQII